MSKVTKLHDNYYAACECRSMTFHLRVDDIADRWNTIIGTECAECGLQKEWIRVDRVDEDD